MIESVGKLTSSDVLLIDAGHGGFDGGAQSASGVPEKDINLAIALQIKELAQKDGWKVIMTREEDVSLAEDAKGAIRSKKTADLTARKALIDKVSPNLTISIHLNSFTEDRSVRGAQVFYPAVPKGKELTTQGDRGSSPEGSHEGNSEGSPEAVSKKIAEGIQAQLISDLNDGKARTALAKSDVLILKNVKTPIVLVECGFLSNREEAELLQQVNYQKKLALSIYTGAMQSMGKTAVKVDKLRVIDSKEQI